MKPISGKEFARILEQHGWILRRIHGSHHIYGKTGTQVRLSVPIHKNLTLKLGLQRHLMNLAELTEKDL